MCCIDVIRECARLALEDMLKFLLGEEGQAAVGVFELYTTCTVHVHVQLFMSI